MVGDCDAEASAQNSTSFVLSERPHYFEFGFGVSFPCKYTKPPKQQCCESLPLNLHRPFPWGLSLKLNSQSKKSTFFM